jgi:hypothetical protein
LQRFSIPHAGSILAHKVMENPWELTGNSRFSGLWLFLLVWHDF